MSPNVMNPLEELSLLYQAAIQAAIRSLIQDKHLYQSAIVELNEPAKARILKTLESRYQETGALERVFGGASPASYQAQALLDREWILEAPQKPPRSSSSTKELIAKVPDVRQFCARCDRSEPFNAVRAESLDFRSAPVIRATTPIPIRTPIQVFALSYHCQGCKQAPEVFLVRREGMKVTLCGRAPMARVEVSKHFPKSVAKFISGALVAHRTGFTLAGVFLLRVAIEQWCAQFATTDPHEVAAAEEESPTAEAGCAARADELISAYMNQLPEDFRARFPSLRVLYGILSVDIHRAIGSPDTFELAFRQLDEHFDARRLYKLDGPPAPPPDSGGSRERAS